MRQVVATFFCICVTSLAGADTLQIPLRGGERFLLKAYDAQITWVNTPGSHLKVTGLTESQGVRRGDQLIFDLKEVSSKEDFASIMKKKKDSLKIEIVGPSMPAEFNLRDGSVSLSGLNHEVKIQMVQGNISQSKSHGTSVLRLHKGVIAIQEATAKSSVEVYSGQVNLKDVVDSEVDLFSGQLSVQHLTGTLALTTQSASAKIASMNGTLTVDSQKSAINLSQFQGRLEGHTQEGSLSAQLLPDTEVQLKSQSGRLNFQVPKESGAFLNLWTGEGDLSVPSELKVAHLASEKMVKGRLRGESKKISINARTTEGVVTVK